MITRQSAVITTHLCRAAAIVVGLPASSRQVPQEPIEQMPAALETEFALSGCAYRDVLCLRTGQRP